MNIDIKKPNNETRIVDAIEYNGRTYTRDDLDLILISFERTRDMLSQVRSEIREMRAGL